MAGNVSTGRGGSGNMAKNSPVIQPSDLETPTLKTSVVTTGRGGSGNMAKNVDPAETRALQDVQPVIGTHKTKLWGRGGSGNQIDQTKAKKVEDAVDDEGKKSSDGSLATKGKEWLFGKKA